MRLCSFCLFFLLNFIHFIVGSCAYRFDNFIELKIQKSEGKIYNIFIVCSANMGITENEKKKKQGGLYL